MYSNVLNNQFISFRKFLYFIHDKKNMHQFRKKNQLKIFLFVWFIGKDCWNSRLIRLNSRKDTFLYLKLKQIKKKQIKI